MSLLVSLRCLRGIRLTPLVTAYRAVLLEGNVPVAAGHLAILCVDDSAPVPWVA